MTDINVNVEPAEQLNIIVNETEQINVSVEGTISSSNWGGIAGTLSDQTDLQNELDAKLSLDGGIMTGALIARDHGTETVDEVINVVYGTSETPPTASTTTEGTVYFRYSI